MKKRPPSQPVMLTVEPGVEVYYTINGSDPLHHSGSGPLVLAPIHQGVGHPEVRLVAIARENAATFKAKIEPVKLEGDWVFSIKSATIVSMNCPSDDPEEDSSSDLTDSDALLQLTSTLAPLGSYHAADANRPGELEFVLDPGASLKTEPTDPDITYTSSITLKEKEFLMEMELEIPPPAPSGAVPGSQANSAGVALALALPTGLALFFVRRRRRGAAILMSLLAVTMLSGCIGIGISGSFGSEVRFQKLTYVAQPDSSTTPLWHLSDGKGTFDIDLTIEVGVASLDDSPPTTETRVCQATMEITAEGDLFPDGVVTPPED